MLRYQKAESILKLQKNALQIIIALVFVLFISGGCSSQIVNIKPKAESGVLDLTQVRLENDTVALDGEWEFYWYQILSPGETDAGTLTGYIQIPSSWNKIPEIENQSGYGYATFRIQFKIEERARLALKIPRLFTAYELWVNGELAATAGKVGKTRESMVPQYLPRVALIDAQPGMNEIIIQVSNFHHRSGGMLESIYLGGEKYVQKLRFEDLSRELIVFACLICLGAYHLALFFFRKKNVSSLWFGLFCLSIGIRTILVGERFFIYLFPDFSWEVAHKLQTLTYYLGVPLILMFFRSVFPRYFHARIIRIAQVVGAVFGLLVLLTPARIFTLFNPIYQIWSGLLIIYITVALIRLSINKEKGSWFILLGGAALLLSSANDIIFLSIWMNDAGPTFLRDLIRTGSLSSIGQLIFAFLNSLLLAKNFSDALDQEEVLTARLTEINTHLDELVLQRTEDLKKSNEQIEQQKVELEIANQTLQKLSYKDQLSGVWNRRKYDQMIEKEWRRCLRHQRPIAILLVDIDFFKEFNDSYGHMAGDTCLVQIGEVLNHSLNRSTDMVARYGGDEFVVLLPETEKEEAMRTAEMLRQKVEALRIPHASSTVSDYVTVTIGVTSLVPNQDLGHADLFGFTDKALYEAKSEGKNQVKFCCEVAQEEH
ncbi:MAG: diguanylate cyclase [Christensenellales bacterium]|jgi:diguanylate cyclase (GGDEF)-like protein